MTLFETAIAARLPLIAIQTDDLLSVQDVLGHLAKKAVKLYPKAASGATTWNASVPVSPGEVYYTTEEVDATLFYKKMQASEASLVLVNVKEKGPAFDAGFLTFPRELLVKFVKEHAPQGNVEPLVSALSGLSYRDAVHIANLATAEFKAFTPDSVLAIRRKYVPLVGGLELIDTKQFHYHVAPELEDWLNLDGRLFKVAKDRLLVPRGLLLAGPPGTGKTSGAKHIAARLEVPLYRLDMAGVLNKYLGESERNLKLALSQLETLQPCVFLIDEVEKLFAVSDGDTTGVSSRVLAWLLWWLQEHSLRVLTVMTTNREEAIPPELYRAGRIDRQIWLGKLSGEQTALYVSELVSKLSYLVPLDASEITHNLFGISGNDGTVAPAVATEFVLSECKKRYLQSMKE